MSKTVNSALELIGKTPLLKAERYSKKAGATEAAIYECQDYAPNWLTVSVLYAINEVV